MTISRIGTPARRVLTAFAFATLAVALVGVAPGLAEAQASGCTTCHYTRFAHPQPDDMIPAGQAIEVVAVAIGAAPPPDLVLVYSENQGATYLPVEDQAIRGRAIHGTYHPTALQAGVVIFSTRSASDNSFGTTIHVFVQY